MNDVLCGNLLQWSGAFQLQLPVRIVWECVLKKYSTLDLFQII